MFLLALLLCLSLGLFMGFLPKLAQKYLFFKNLYRKIKSPFIKFQAYGALSVFLITNLLKLKSSGNLFIDFFGCWFMFLLISSCVIGLINTCYNIDLFEILNNNKLKK